MGFYGAFYSDGEISICMEHMVSERSEMCEKYVSKKFLKISGCGEQQTSVCLFDLEPWNEE